MKIIKIILWVIGSLALFLFILYVFGNTFKTYIGNYFAAVELPKGRSYNSVVEIYGEPLNIIPFEDNNNYFTAQYDGIEFVFTGDYVSAVRIYSSDYQFGKKKIGVGSTRKEVKNAYNGRLYKMAKTINRFLFSDRPTLNGQISERPDGGFTVIDGITWVEFHFDGGDKVNKMVIYDNGP